MGFAIARSFPPDPVAGFSNRANLRREGGSAFVRRQWGAKVVSVTAYEPSVMNLLLRPG